MLRVFLARSFSSSSRAPPSQIVARVARLRDLLRSASEQYYRPVETGPAAAPHGHGQWHMSDGEWDQLLVELAMLEEKYPSLQDPESPTVTVGTAPSVEKPDGVGEFELTTVPHLSPMLSLANTYTLDGVQRFLTTCGETLGRDTRFSVEDKYDGVALSLRYTGEKVSLSGAVLRGDGRRGEVVTAHVSTHVVGIPHSIPSLVGVVPPGSLVEVRGELVADAAELTAVNAERASLGLPTYANPRNMVAGWLNTKLTDRVWNGPKGLHFVAYAAAVPAEEQQQQQQQQLQQQARKGNKGKNAKISKGKQKGGEMEIDAEREREKRGEEGASTAAASSLPASHVERMRLLSEGGFSTDASLFASSDIDTLLESIGERSRWFREGGTAIGHGLPTDGVVVKVDDVSVRGALGATSRAPRWAIAYKHTAEALITTVTNVTMQVGRTGRATPVANLAPITIDGAVVSRATLHNVQRMHEMGVAPGKRVMVRRAGAVIPQVVGLAPDSAENNSSLLSGDHREVFVKSLLECCPCARSSPLSPVGKINPDHISTLGDIDRLNTGHDSSERPVLHPHWACTDPECGQLLWQKVTHFASKSALDIDGLGTGTIAALMDAGVVNGVSDIVNLEEKADEMMALDGFGEKRVNRIIRGVKSALANATPERILMSLGISHLGGDTASALVNHFGSLQAVMEKVVLEVDRDAALAAVSSIHGIGPITAQSLVAELGRPDTARVLESLCRRK